MCDLDKGCEKVSNIPHPGRTDQAARVVGGSRHDGLMNDSLLQSQGRQPMECGLPS